MYVVVEFSDLRRKVREEIKSRKMALFGGSSSSRSHQKNVVEFRAGKMNLKGNTVTADKRKGLVYVYQSEDGLTHFCWKDRKTGTVEDVSNYIRNEKHRIHF